MARRCIGCIFTPHLYPTFAWMSIPMAAAAAAIGSARVQLNMRDQAPICNMQWTARISLHWFMERLRLLIRKWICWCIVCTVYEPHLLSHSFSDSNLYFIPSIFFLSVEDCRDSWMSIADKFGGKTRSLMNIDRLTGCSSWAGFSYTLWLTTSMQWISFVYCEIYWEHLPIHRY